MPRIPQVTEASVEIQNPANARVATGGVNADAFGAGQGESLQKLGGAITQFGVVMEKQREQKAVSDGMDAYNDLQDASLSKRIELEQRMGKDADGIEKEYSEWYNQKRQEIGGKLNQPESVALFDRNANKLGLNNRSWGANYEQNQMNVYHDATMKTSVANAENNALLDPSLENYTQSMADIRSYYRDMAVRRGFDEGWIDANVRQSEHKIQRDVLSNAMDQDSASGVSGYLEQFGDKLDPTLRGKAEKWLHNKYIDESSGAYADTLIASGASLEDALEGAKKKYSGDDLEKVENKILRNYGRQNQIKNARTKEINDQFEEIAYKTGVENLTDDQLDDLAQTDAGAALRWKTLRNKTMEVKAKGGEYADDSDVEIKSSLNRAIIDGDIKDEQAIRKYKGALSKSDYNDAVKLMEIQQTLKDSDAESAFKIVTGDKYDKSEKTFEKYVAFQNWAAAQIKSSGRAQDINALAAKWFLKGEVQSGAWYKNDEEKTYGEALQSGEADRFVPDEELKETPVTKDYLERQKVEAGRAAQIEAAKKWLETADPNDPKTIAVRKKLGM